ncbi:MAG: LysR family transcriptional regulator [Eisenbergiella massiliensis]
MTIRHMEILKTIAETGSFTKAARVLYITQSAISHAVRELEEESGTVLFDRLSKSVRLTEAGSLLLRETLPVLAACNALEKRMRHLEQHAPIHLVSSITIATYYLPCALRSFSLTHPDISISVDVVSAANALLVLQAGEADFALIEGLPPQGPYVSIPFLPIR